MRFPPFLFPLTDVVPNMSEFTMSPWTITASATSSYLAHHESPRDRPSCAERTGCRYWAATRYHKGALGGERLRRRKKSKSGITSCETQITKGEFERAAVEAEVHGDSSPTIFPRQYMQSLYINGDDNIAAARGDGWLMAITRHPNLEPRNSEGGGLGMILVFVCVCDNSTI